MFNTGPHPKGVRRFDKAKVGSCHKNEFGSTHAWTAERKNAQKALITRLIYAQRTGSVVLHGEACLSVDQA